MKRSDALQPLSRDHHQALFIAQRMKRVTEENAAETTAAFLDFWHEHGRRHFRDEEEILLPAFAEFGDVTDPLVARILTDHVAIRHRAKRLEDGGDGAAGAGGSSPEDGAQATGDGVTPMEAFGGVELPPPGTVEDLHGLGELLSDHVRREERELFPMIEAAMPSDAAAELAGIFVAAEQARGTD